MWVVKLGGSLANEVHLKQWLEALAPLPILLVPGGGPFADTVRTSQARWHFSDTAAHEMALLAMRQYGCMLADLAGGLPTVETIDALAPSGDRATVWLPCPKQLASIEASWTVTSDSLAVWVAKKFAATHVLLVKAALQGPRIDWGYERHPTARQLSEIQLVDRAFPSYLDGFHGHCWLAGPAQFRDLPTSLLQPELSFLGIEKAV